MHRILILHHVEQTWENLFDKEVLLQNILSHVHRSKRYDEVILTVLDGSGNIETDVYPELLPVVTRVEEWGFAFEPPNAYCAIDHSEDDYCVKYHDGINPEDVIPVASAHLWAYVYGWIKELSGSHISLAGGHYEQCLRDMRDTLEHLNIRYRLIESCIYGR